MKPKKTQLANILRLKVFTVLKPAYGGETLVEGSQHLVGRVRFEKIIHYVSDNQPRNKLKIKLI
jgi:hypothetical protein